MPCADAILEDLLFYGVDTCDGMNADPANDPCEKATKELTALILNVCSERAPETCEVDLQSQGCLSTDVGSLLEELAGYIAAGSCEQARECAETSNDGQGLIEDANGGASRQITPTGSRQMEGRGTRSRLGG
jgi:hypothetical protein